MATIPIAPRADNDGGTLGKATQRWSAVYTVDQFIYGNISDGSTVVPASTALSLLNDLTGLTTAEATQLKNIDSTTISSVQWGYVGNLCLLYTSPSPRDKRQSRMPSSA